MSRRNAPENFFFRGTGLPRVMRKNQPLVPRSNFGGKACARTACWFRGQTLPVPGHRGGGYEGICGRHRARMSHFAVSRAGACQRSVVNSEAATGPVDISAHTKLLQCYGGVPCAVRALCTVGCSPPPGVR